MSRAASVVGSAREENLSRSEWGVVRTTRTHANTVKIAALLWIDRHAHAWNETLVSLLQNEAIGNIHVGFAANQPRNAVRVSDRRIVFHPAEISQADMVEIAGSGTEAFLLFVTWPSRFSRDAFILACTGMAADPRIGSVSFLANSAGAFSFPNKNTATPFGVEGHDEVSLTARLRADATGSWRPTPVAVAEGAAVLISGSALEVCGNLDDLGAGNCALAVSELSMRLAKRGFNNYLDTFTYIYVPWDGVEPYQSVLMDANARHELNQRHPHFPINYDSERTRSNSVLAEDLDHARARATGLRILIDGSALGPKEMGTQSLTLHLCNALADRSDVQFVCVAVPDPTSLPAYAKALAKHSKVQIISSGNLEFPDAPYVDVIHRPYQPSTMIPWDRWRGLAKRALITVQDLIAYKNAVYFADPTEWVGYRDNFLRQISQVDGVISISRDVVKIIREERLPIDPSRIFVAENGADARSKDELTSIPDAILDRGWASNSYLFVLGASYAHKNRDLAIKVWKKLRAKGFSHKLILAGASVPFGSNRVEESILFDRNLDGNILVLPDVSAEERNWLLRNASLAVYLTSAEGFGLVPFEAARVDVPTLHVSFGPLRELIDDHSLPTSYEFDGLVARAETLLTDPAAVRASVGEVLRNIETLNWKETARKCVVSYFEVLNMPARMHGA